MCPGRHQLLPKTGFAGSPSQPGAPRRPLRTWRGPSLTCSVAGMPSEDKGVNALRCPGQPCARRDRTKVRGSPTAEHCPTVTSPFRALADFTCPFSTPKSSSEGTKCSVLCISLGRFAHGCCGSCFSECKPGLTPIFEAQLRLAAPDLVFCPSLESGVQGGFSDIVEGLVASIFRMSSLVPRLSPHHSAPHYQVLVCRVPPPRSRASCGCCCNPRPVSLPRGTWRVRPTWPGCGARSWRGSST